MFVPAHNDRLMSSAARVDADVLLLDIEDSVQPAANKQVARDNILRYLADGRFRGRVLYPRVNDRESGELLRDVYQLTVEGIAGFMYPKSKAEISISSASCSRRSNTKRDFRSGLSRLFRSSKRRVPL